MDRNRSNLWIVIVLLLALTALFYSISCNSKKQDTDSNPQSQIQQLQQLDKLRARQEKIDSLKNQLKEMEHTSDQALTWEYQVDGYSKICVALHKYDALARFQNGLLYADIKPEEVGLQAQLLEIELQNRAAMLAKEALTAKEYLRCPATENQPINTNYDLLLYISNEGKQMGGIRGIDPQRLRAALVQAAIPEARKLVKLLRAEPGSEDRKGALLFYLNEYELTLKQVGLTPKEFRELTINEDEEQ